MTTQAKAAEGTNSAQVEPVAAGALARVQGGKPWTMLDLAKMLDVQEPVFTDGDNLPKAPPKVKFTDVLRGALKALPDVFGAVMPDDARLLDRHEVRALTDEANVIDTVLAELTARKESIKEIVRNHQDRQAEAGGLPPGAVRGASGVTRGHWIVAGRGEPYKTPVDGYVDSWEQRYVAGRPSVVPGLLDEMESDGRVTRKEYLACTTESRSYDEGKLQAFIKKDPVRGLEILRAMTTRSAPGASLYAPGK